MIKVLHIGDIHLERPFGGWSSGVSAALRQGIADAFEASVDHAIGMGTDLYILAGDICDHRTMMPRTAHFFERQLSRLVTAGVSVLLVTGNHDPWNNYARIPYFNLPDGVMVAGTPEPTVWNLVSKDGDAYVVVACGHHEQGITEDVISKFPTKEELLVGRSHMPVIGAAHCAVVNSKGQVESGHIPYMPVHLESLKSLGYDYMALGHVHKPMVWHDGRIAYSGSLQGLDMDDVGERGGWILTLDSGAMKHGFKTFSKFRFEKIMVDCQGITSVEGLICQVRDVFADGHEPVSESENVLLEVALKGASSIHGWLSERDEQEWLIETLKDALGVLALRLDTGALSPEICVDGYMETETFLGELLRMADEDMVLEASLADEELVLMGRFSSADERRHFIRETLKKGKEELVRLFVRYDHDH